MHSPRSFTKRLFRRPGPHPAPHRGHLHVVPEDASGTADQSRPERWSWGTLLRPLDESLRRTSSSPLSLRSVLQLRYYWLDGVFASFSENLYGTFVTLFALAYGATSGQIGLLSALAGLASMISLFPGARVVEHTGRPRRLVVWVSGVGGRVPFAAAALLPLAIVSPAAMVWCVLVLNALRAFAMSFPYPAWMAMTAELVPEGVRGRFFASKNIAMGVVAFAAGPLGGLLIRIGNRLAGLGPQPGYQSVFWLCFVSGMVATVCFWRIPDPPFHKPDEGFRLRGLLRAVTEVRMFPVFLVSGLVWNLGTQISGPFFTVCMVQSMHATSFDVGLNAGISALFALAGQYLFGRMVDRRGSLTVQVVTGFIISVLPLPWIWATRPWHAWFMAGSGGFFWAGFNLANFNLLLELTPQRLRVRAVAAFQSVVYATAVVGPLVGGAIVEAGGFVPVWIVSAAGRFAGALIFAVGVATVLRKGRTAPPTAGTSDP